jgi:hypothetical protein
MSHMPDRSKHLYIQTGRSAFYNAQHIPSHGCWVSPLQSRLILVLRWHLCYDSLLAGATCMHSMHWSGCNVEALRIAFSGLESLPAMNLWCNCSFFQLYQDKQETQ